MIITLAAITLAAANPFPEPADDVDGALTSVGLNPLLAVGGHDEKGAVELPWDLAQGSVHGECFEKKSALISKCTLQVVPTRSRLPGPKELMLAQGPTTSSNRTMGNTLSNKDHSMDGIGTRNLMVVRQSGSARRNNGS